MQTFYRVQMENEIGSSPPSDPEELRITHLKPGPIILDKTKCIIGPTSITLTWKMPYNPAAVNCYQIEKKVGRFGWVKLAEVQGQEDLMFTDTHLKPNTEQSYRILAKAENCMQPSNEQSLRTDSDRPNQPTMGPTVDVISEDKAVLCVPRPSTEEHNGSPIQCVVIEKSYDNGKSWEHQNIKMSSGESNLHLEQSLKSFPQISDFYLVSFRVRFENAKGLSDPSPICDLTSHDLIPGQPETVTHQVSSQSVSLSWNQPSLHPRSVECYNVQYKVEGAEWVPNVPQMCTDLHYTLSNLFPNTQSEYRVCALNRNGKRGKYYFDTIVTNKRRPNKPVNVSVAIKVSELNSVVKITAPIPDLNESGSPVSEICLYEYDDDDKLLHCSKKEVIRNDDVDNQLIVTVPIEDKTHSVRISFINEMGESERSDPLEIKTSELRPGRVSFLCVKQVTSTSITLSWDKPEYMGKAAKNYEVLVECGENREIFQTQSSTDIKIGYLKPYSKYRVSVCAVNGNLKGKFTEIEAKTAAAPPLKPRIESMVISDRDEDSTIAIIKFPRLTKEERGSPVDSVELQWSYDTGIWYSYTQWDIDQSRKIEIIEKEFVLPVEVTQAGEAKSTYYRIIMWSKQFQSEPSDPHIIESANLRPGRVESLCITNIGVHSVTLTWDPPRTNSNAIKRYVINCCERSNKNRPIPLPIHEVDTKHTSVQIVQLKSGQTYEIEIYAATNGCIGVKNKIEFKTREIIFAAPQNIRAEFRQREAMKIRWTKPSQPDSSESPTYYKVSVPCVKFTRLTKGMSTVIRGLEPSEEYTVRVTSMNENGNFDRDGGSTASGTFWTTMSMAKRLLGGIGLATPTLGIGTGIFLQSTKQADNKDMVETDEEYT